MSAGTLRSISVAVLAAAIVNTSISSTVHASIIDTGSMVQTARSVDLDSIRAQLQRAEVREELARLGVDETALEARLQNLSDSELAMLSKQMQDAPAGGNLLALVGAVFVVLLVLEWVGVIDIFKKR
jgi:diacylglycerol kinase